MGKGLAVVVVMLAIGSLLASCGDDDGGQLDGGATPDTGTTDTGTTDTGTPDTGATDTGGAPPDDTSVPPPDGGSCVPPGGKCLKHKECGAWKCSCTDGPYPINSQWCKEGACVVELEACTNICGDPSKVKSAVYQGCM